VKGFFDHSEVDRAITKEEALRILREAQQAGLVHTTGNYRDNHNYICNCCTCSCGILRGVAEFGILSAVAHSDFRAAADPDVCLGCGDCVARCQFGALSLTDGGDLHAACVVGARRCVGCGQCAIVCPSGALQMVRRPEDDLAPLVADYKEWTVKRAWERGIDLSGIQ
jgi:electron transport complex protein RnfB